MLNFFHMNKINVLQICHSYDAPFEVVADFYASLFPPEKFNLTTLFLKGKPKSMMPSIQAGRRLFFNLSSNQLKGVKRTLIKKTKNEWQL